jgi:hypothetical protein
LLIDPSPEGVVTHEYGHILAGKALRADSAAYKATVDPLVRGTGVEMTLSTGQTVQDLGWQSPWLMPSAYGSENPVEAEAEMFAAHVAGRTAYGPEHPWSEIQMERSNAYVAALQAILQGGTG